MSKGLKTLVWVVVAFFIGFVVVPAAYNALFPDPAEAYQAEQDQEKKDAYVYAREIVKEQLKVPSSAEFQKAYEVNITEIGAAKYSFQFWLEAQNSFGAKVRTTYNCTMQRKDGKWHLIRLEEL